MNNITNIIKSQSCYGCGVCVVSCPKNIISMRLNDDGFYIPVIVNDSLCIECKICEGVCAFAHEQLALENKPIKAWGAWSDDSRVRQKCSSGGVGFEIGRALLKKGYKVVGCRYNVEKQRAEHYIASSEEELVQSIGSKYIQSQTEEAFKLIDRKQKYLVVGTPCQIDSFRRMIKKFRCEENFVLMDFFCHCVPSMNAWDAYLKMLKSKIGNIAYISWRNKFDYGWHDSWLMGADSVSVTEPAAINSTFDSLIQEKKTAYQSRWSQGDLFYNLFLGDVCFGEQCEKNCKYKYDRSSADIRIGDLWGKTYKEDEKGTSALVAFTDKGMSVIQDLKNVTKQSHTFDVVAEGQMKENVKKKKLYPIIMYMLRHRYSITGLSFRSVMFAQRVLSYIERKLK